MGWQSRTVEDKERQGGLRGRKGEGEKGGRTMKRGKMNGERREGWVDKEGRWRERKGGVGREEETEINLIHYYMYGV